MQPQSAELKLASISKLTEDLAALGIVGGDAVMVHASLRSVGPTENRGEGLITALINALGPQGTLMAYADFHPTPEIPYFDPKRSPARPAYGVFPELLRRWPGACRSENPGASIVAVGHRAEWLCEKHPLNYGYGIEGPLGKFATLGGKVLLLGSDPDQVTLLHLAEHSAKLEGKRIVHRAVDLLKADGSIQRVEIEEFDTSSPVVATMPKRIFALIVESFIESGAAIRGQVARAPAVVLPADQLLRFAVSFIEREYGLVRSKT